MVKKERVFGGSNPFEVNVPRQKFTVLNRTVKGTKPTNIVKSRTKAISDRKQTLLAELQGIYKSNEFVDSRIGEGTRKKKEEEKKSQEDKDFERYKVVRTKELLGGRKGSKSRFALADEDELTHMGQSLGSASYTGNDEEDDEHDDHDHDEGGELGSLDADKLNARDAKRQALLADRTPEERAKMTHREIMSDVMRKSKLLKAERQASNSELAAFADELDANFQDISKLLEAGGDYKTDVCCIFTTHHTHVIY